MIVTIQLDSREYDDARMLERIFADAVSEDTPSEPEQEKKDPPKKRPRRPRKKKEDPAPDPAQTDIEEEAAKAEPEPTEPELESPADTDSEVTIALVRDAFTAFAQKKGVDEALALLRKFGVKRVSEISEDKFPELMKALNG